MSVTIRQPLLALAHPFEKLVWDGAVRDYADLARLPFIEI